MTVYPLPLQQGDLIGVTSPSSGVTSEYEWQLQNAVSQLSELGYEVTFTKSVRGNNKLRSTTARERAIEFTQLYNNSQVKAIIPSGGGEFLMEILPYLNFKELIEPKWILGYSDISTLLLPFTLNTGFASVSGPVFMDFGYTPVDRSLMNALKVLNLKKDEHFSQKSYSLFQNNRINFNNTDIPMLNLTESVLWKSLEKKEYLTFEGRIIGGCMDTVCKLIGTPFLPIRDFIEKYKQEGIIWYFDSCDMNAADIYRTLWQMKYNGWFQFCQGILIGRPEGYSDVFDFTFFDALSDALSSLDVPVIYDVDIGHKPPQMSIINGCYTKVEFVKGEGLIKQFLI
ncbi:S66 peptidase family protein [Bacillus spongiae]|uniref:S66 peptidase family protein n=1 Tax=Bacillus spongiae TaxID=2683610 RepID=A0ABU8HAQ3_9BACI